MRTILLLLTSGWLLLFAGSTQAQDAAFCQNYARTAVEQQASNQARSCGFEGPRWSNDYQAHHAWCQNVAWTVAEEEQRAREKALSDTCSTRAESQSGLQMMEMVTLQPGAAAQAAFCEAYARAAVEQQAANQARSCGFTGPRWSGDYQAHHAWCLLVDRAQAEQEHQGRQTELDTSCAGRGIGLPNPGVPVPPSGQGPDSPPASPPPGPGWKSITATPVMAPVPHGVPFINVTRWEVNACENKLRLWIDRSGTHWTGEVRADLYDGARPNAAPFGHSDFSAGPYTESLSAPLEPGQPGSPGRLPVQVVLRLRTADQRVIDAGNPPYAVTLRRYRRPEVATIVPDQVQPGTTTLITITGKDLVVPGETPTIKVLGYGMGELGWPIRVTSASPTLLQAAVTVPPGTPPKQYWLGVMQQCVGSSGPANFTVLGKSLN